MDLRSKMDDYELVAIALIIIGAALLLVSGIVNYLVWKEMITNSNIERYAEMVKLIRTVRIAGELVFGIGIFMSFERVYNKLDLNKLFLVINRIYIALFIPAIYLLYLHIFTELRNVSPLVSELYISSIYILPNVRHLLLVIMIIFILISIFRKTASLPTN